MSLLRWEDTAVKSSYALIDVAWLNSNVLKDNGSLREAWSNRDTFWETSLFSNMSVKVLIHPGHGRTSSG